MSVTEYDEENCPACGKDLIEMCCIECGEVLSATQQEQAKASINLGNAFAVAIQ